MRAKKSVRARAAKALSQAEIRIHHGPEPELPETPSNLDWIQAFNWYNACTTQDDRNTYLEQYALSQNLDDVVREKLARRGFKMCSTFAYLARIKSRMLPGHFPPEYEESLREAVETFIANLEADEEDAPKPIVKKDALLPLMIQRFELTVDAFLSGSLLSLPDLAADLQAEFPAAGATRYKALRERVAHELDALRRDAADTEQVGAGLAPKQANKLASWLEGLLSAFQQSEAVAKTARAPMARKPKAINAEKVTRNVKHQPQSKELGVVSLAPEQCVGAKCVWVYNTKTRRILFFEGDSLSFKGASLTGVTRSGGKRVRKPEVTIPEIKAATRNNAMMKYEALSTEPWLASPRFNDQTIILSVFK